MENEILSILKDMQNSIKNLEKGQNDIKADVSTLKEDVNTLKEDVNVLKTDVKEIKKEMNVVYDQTAYLIEFRTEVNIKLDDLNDLEKVTRTNCYDIAKLRQVN